MPLLQLEPPRATGSGAAATSEERATTGKRRADARKNILPELRKLEVRLAGGENSSLGEYSSRQQGFYTSLEVSENVYLFNYGIDSGSTPSATTCRHGMDVEQSSGKKPYLRDCCFTACASRYPHAVRSSKGQTVGLFSSQRQRSNPGIHSPWLESTDNLFLIKRRKKLSSSIHG